MKYWADSTTDSKIIHWNSTTRKDCDSQWTQNMKN